MYIGKLARLAELIRLRRCLWSCEYRSTICSKMVCNTRDLGRGIGKLCIFIFSVHRIAHQKNAPVCISWLLGLTHREKLQRLGVRNSDVLYPIVRIFSRRLKRLEVKAAQRIVPNDENLAALLDQTLRRFDEFVIKLLPRSSRLMQHILRRKNCFCVGLNQRSDGLASRERIELLARRSDHPEVRGLRPHRIDQDSGLQAGGNRFGIQVFRRLTSMLGLGEMQAVGEGFCTAFVNHTQGFIWPVLTNQELGIGDVEIIPVRKEGQRRLNTSEGRPLALKSVDGAPEPLVCLRLSSCLRVNTSKIAFCLPL